MNFNISAPSFIHLRNFRILEVQGTDAATFLHRLSTNNVRDLSLGSTCLSAFLNEKGRLVALAYIRFLHNDSYQLFVPYDDSNTLHDWLDQYLFSEDVSLKHIEQSVFWILGGETTKGSLIGPEFRFAKQSSGSHFEFRDSQKAEKFHESLLNKGFILLSATEFEALRIAGGVPFSKNEINPQHSPVQLGLAKAIHWAKGCYIGQEIISRLESKDRFEPTNYKVRSSANDFASIKTNDSLVLNDYVLGTVTSLSSIFIPDQAQALIVLKNPASSNHLFTKNTNVRLDIMARGE